MNPLERLDEIDSAPCPERAYRASLTDDEFWDYALNGVRPGDSDDDDGPDLGIETSQTVPCLECGEHGACAWDAEGRPLIHAITAVLEASE